MLFRRRKSFDFWLEKLGYEWIGEHHPKKPIERPKNMQFTKKDFLFDMELFEKHGHAKKIRKK